VTTIRYLEFKGYTPAGAVSHKVWAQACGAFGYATFWGPYNGPYQHNVKMGVLSKEREKDASVKIQKGYALAMPNHSFRTYVENMLSQLVAPPPELSGLTVKQINQAAKSYSQPAVALTGAEQHCKFCQVYSANAHGEPPRVEWNKTECAFCKRRAGSHSQYHPHDAGACPGFSWLPMPKELPTAQAESNCEFCKNNLDLLNDARASWLSQPCKCGVRRGAHASMHPHQHSFHTCIGFELADCELCAAQSKEPEENTDLMRVHCECGVKAGIHGWLHPHSRNTLCSGFVRIAEPITAEPNAPELPLLDLPCDCGHWLNVHAAPGEMTLRSCLLSTCSCEFYRRTCSECGEVTRTAWRHAVNCVRGKFERKGTTEREATRAPRRISHLLNEL